MTRVEKKLEDSKKVKQAFLHLCDSACHTNVYCDLMLTTDCFISKLDSFIFVSSVNKRIPFRLRDSVNELI